MTNRSRAGDRQNPRGASAIERAGVIRDPTRGLHQGQQPSAARTGRTHDCTRPTSDVAFFPLHRRARPHMRPSGWTRSGCRFDRLLGAAFGAVRGLVIAAALVTVLVAFAPSPPPKSIVDSKVMPYVIAASNILAAATPHEIKDAFRQAREKAEKAWSDHARTESGGLRRE